MTVRRILVRLAELELQLRIGPDRLTPLWWAALATLPVDAETKAAWASNATRALAGQPLAHVAIPGFVGAAETA